MKHVYVFPKGRYTIKDFKTFSIGGKKVKRFTVQEIGKFLVVSF